MPTPEPSVTPPSRYICQPMLKRLFLLLLTATVVWAGDQPKRIEPDVASQSLVKNLARAYFLTGQLDKADLMYDRSVAIFGAAIVALPDMRDNYTARLKQTLLEYAKLKDSRGEADSAKELERKAAELQTK